MPEKGKELAAISPEEAAFLQPPPSYEEVMGVYQTSVKDPIDAQVPELPPLAYMDIMPRCLKVGNIRAKVQPTFETFGSIMEGANRWLKDNPGYRVWKCESIERKLDVAKDGSLTYNLNDMLHHDSIFGYTVYIRGLRLWLMKANSGSPLQALGVRNMEPPKKVIEMPTRYRKGKVIIGGEVTAFGCHQFETFVGLQDTITLINKELASDPIQGSILTVETDSVKAFQSFHKDFDPEATCWSEDKIKFRRMTQVVRIYYIQGSPAKEEIILKDFEPDLLDHGDAIKPPKFAVIQSTIDNINQWLPSAQGLKIVNIQQNDAIVKHFMDKNEIQSDSTDNVVSFTQSNIVASVLRVFCVKSAATSSQPPANYVTSRIFLPARTGPKSFESMNQTMDRIDAWLKITGVPIYNVESVRFLFSEPRPDGADVTRSSYYVSGSSGKHWLQAIRVYFPCNFEEPDPSLLPPPPPPRKSGSSSCSIL